MTHKALERDATLMVEVGYDAPVRKRSVTGSSHQHGISIGKTLVSKKKRRLITEDGFDLDLAYVLLSSTPHIQYTHTQSFYRYITSNIVAMGFPPQTLRAGSSETISKMLWIFSIRDTNNHT